MFEDVFPDLFGYEIVSLVPLAGRQSSVASSIFSMRQAYHVGGLRRAGLGRACNVLQDIVHVCCVVERVDDGTDNAAWDALIRPDLLR